jgi:hypothetical protein
MVADATMKNQVHIVGGSTINLALPMTTRHA